MSNPKTPPAFAADEAQPQSAIAEHNARSEREDGTNRGGEDGLQSGVDAVPEIALTDNERQDIDPGAEALALSEHEDGTNLG